MIQYKQRALTTQMVKEAMQLAVDRFRNVLVAQYSQPVAQQGRQWWGIGHGTPDNDGEPLGLAAGHGLRQSRFADARPAPNADHPHTALQPATHLGFFGLPADKQGIGW